jgi:hypothetical protein
VLLQEYRWSSSYRQLTVSTNEHFLYRRKNLAMSRHPLHVEFTMIHFFAQDLMRSSGVGQTQADNLR